MKPIVGIHGMGWQLAEQGEPISVQIQGMDLDAPSHLNIAYLSVIGYDQLKEDNSIRTDNISMYKKQTLINPNVPLDTEIDNKYVPDGFIIEHK